MTVENEASHHPVFGELLPNVVGVALDYRVRPVAQMCREARAGVRGGADLRAGGGGVSHRGDHAIVGDRSNVRDRSLVLRAEGDDPASPAGSSLPSPILGDI